MSSLREPLVTLVTPSYNQGRFLEETILSVLEQDYPNLEYLVVDGGSTDGSVELIRAYQDRIAWWASEPDRGQADALNRAFRRAKGEILGWINADDTLLPGTVSKVVEALLPEPAALLAYGDNVYTDESSQSFGSLGALDYEPVEMVREMLNRVVQPGSLFTRRAWDIAGPFDIDLYYYFDFAFVLRLAGHGRVVRLPDKLATYRIHDESKSGAAPLLRAEDHLRFLDVLFAGPLRPELRAAEAQGRSRGQLVVGELLYEGGRHRAARAALLRGARLWPRNASRRTLAMLLRTALPVALVKRLRLRRARQSGRA